MVFGVLFYVQYSRREQTGELRLICYGEYYTCASCVDKTLNSGRLRVLFWLWNERGKDLPELATMR